MPNRRLSTSDPPPTNERSYSLFEDVTLLNQIIKHKAHLPDGRRAPFNAEALTRVHEAFTDAVILENGLCNKSSVGALKKRYERLRELHDTSSLADDSDLGLQRQILMSDVVRQQAAHEAEQSIKSKATKQAMVIDFEDSFEQQEQQEQQDQHSHHTNPPPPASNQTTKLSPDTIKSRGNDSANGHVTVKHSPVPVSMNNHRSNDKSSGDDSPPLQSKKSRPRHQQPDQEQRLHKRARTDLGPLPNGIEGDMDIGNTQKGDHGLMYRLALNAQKVTLASVENERRRARLEADRMKLEALRMERDEAEREERVKMIDSWKEVEVARIQAEAKKEEHRAKLEMERLKYKEDEKKSDRNELERLVRDRERAELAIDGWRAEVDRLKWEQERNQSYGNRARRPFNNDRNRNRPGTPRRRPATPGPSPLRRQDTPRRNERPDTPKRPGTPRWLNHSPDRAQEPRFMQRDRAEIPRDSNDI